MISYRSFRKQLTLTELEWPRTKHHTVTTPAPPFALKNRRFAPDNSNILKKEFYPMIQLGLTRPSNSPWAAPLPTGFGLPNAEQMYQRFIDEPLKCLDFCYAYIDVILVASSSHQELFSFCNKLE